MSQHSKIEWTEATWNPVRGCSKISPGCKHCYAAVFAERWRGIPGHAYEQGFDLRLVPEMLATPLKWREPRTVFVNSMSDLFHEQVPFEFVAAVFGVMAATPRHTYQVLTKRPERMREFFAWAAELGSGCLNGHALPAELLACAWEACSGDAWDEVEPPEDWVIPTPDVFGRAWPLPNVWLGVSVEDRKYGMPRIDELRATPAAVRFLSVEPLLEDFGTLDFTGIDWVIVGGESGHGAQPLHPDWVRNIRDQVLALRRPCGGDHEPGPRQCMACGGRGWFGPALFWKQWGEYGPTGERDGHPVHLIFHDRTEWINKASTRMAKGDEVVGITGKVLRVGADFTPDQFPAAIVRKMGKAKAGRELDGCTWDEMPRRRV